MDEIIFDMWSRTGCLVIPNIRDENKIMGSLGVLLNFKPEYQIINSSTPQFFCSWTEGVKENRPSEKYMVFSESKMDDAVFSILLEAIPQSTLRAPRVIEQLGMLKTSLISFFNRIKESHMKSYALFWHPHEKNPVITIRKKNDDGTIDILRVWEKPPHNCTTNVVNSNSVWETIKTNWDQSQVSLFKTMLAWEMASVFKHYLFERRWNYYPFLLLKGSGDKGKSTLASLAFFDFWGCNCFDERYGDGSKFKGSLGSRLVNLHPSTLPLFIDDLTENITDSHVDFFKTYATTGVARTSKGVKSLDAVKEIELYNPIVFATNTNPIQDDALLSRFCVLDFDEVPSNLDKSKLRSITRQIRALIRGEGWRVLNEPVPFDTLSTYLDMAMSEFQNIKSRSKRAFEKAVFIRFGELILAHYNILNEVPLATFYSAETLVQSDKDEIERAILNELTSMRFIIKRQADGRDEPLTISYLNPEFITRTYSPEEIRFLLKQLHMSGVIVTDNKVIITSQFLRTTRGQILPRYGKLKAIAGILGKKIQRFYPPTFGEVSYPQQSYSGVDITDILFVGDEDES